jgi:HEAT repeat protein
MRDTANADAANGKTGRSKMPQFADDDPIQCMEWAKQIVGGKAPYDEPTLLMLAQNSASGEWPRIAALYVLGLVGSRDVCPLIRNLLADPGESEAVRSHAAEALGNLGDRESVGLLHDILQAEPGLPLRESCEYALGEIEVV